MTQFVILCSVNFNYKLCLWRKKQKNTNFINVPGGGYVSE